MRIQRGRGIKMVSVLRTFAVSELLTIKEAAELIKRKPRTVRAHLKELKTVQVGDDYLIDSSDLLDRIRRGKVW
jgi:hypothetical protein